MKELTHDNLTSAVLARSNGKVCWSKWRKQAQNYWQRFSFVYSGASSVSLKAMSGEKIKKQLQKWLSVLLFTDPEISSSYICKKLQGHYSFGKNYNGFKAISGCLNKMTLLIYKMKNSLYFFPFWDLFFLFPALRFNFQGKIGFVGVLPFPGYKTDFSPALSGGLYYENIGTK